MKMIRAKTGFCPVEIESELLLLEESVSDNEWHGFICEV